MDSSPRRHHRGFVCIVLRIRYGRHAADSPASSVAPAPLLALAVVLALLLGCLWVLVKCFRLVTGRKKGGGPLSPKLLRVVAVFLLIIPVAGLFTGYYRAMGLIAIFRR